jgi:hypothetical protein
MENIEKLKLSNTVAMMIMKHPFPGVGKVSINIIMENNKPTDIVIKDVKPKTRKEG